MLFFEIEYSDGHANVFSQVIVMFRGLKQFGPVSGPVIILN